MEGKYTGVHTEALKRLCLVDKDSKTQSSYSSQLMIYIEAQLLMFNNLASHVIRIVLQEKFLKPVHGVPTLFVQTKSRRSNSLYSRC